MKNLKREPSEAKKNHSHRGRTRFIGIGGPVGSGKTALVLQLCLALRDQYNIAVITNDLYTREDAEFLVRNKALEPERILGVETGGCPHAAVREDISINLDAIHELQHRFHSLDLIFVESGGDNLSATFSPELVDGFIYVIDVAEGDKIPRKKGPGLVLCDLLLINKMDLAPYVRADLDVMRRDSQKVRGDRPFIFTNLLTGENLERVLAWLEKWMKSPPKRQSWGEVTHHHDRHTHTHA